MSIEIIATIICDGCGSTIVGPTVRKATHGMCSYWDAKTTAEKAHWLILPRYGKPKHLCARCSDGVTNPDLPTLVRAEPRYARNQ